MYDLVSERKGVMMACCGCHPVCEEQQRVDGMMLVCRGCRNSTGEGMIWVRRGCTSLGKEQHR